MVATSHLSASCLSCRLLSIATAHPPCKQILAAVVVVLVTIIIILLSIVNWHVICHVVSSIVTSNWPSTLQADACSGGGRACHHHHHARCCPHLWYGVCCNDISNAPIVEEWKCAYLADIPLHRPSRIPLPPVTWPISIPCPFQWPHSPFAWGQDLCAHRTVVSTKLDPQIKKYS